ncbi:MAG: CHAT domain-containing protein [Cytophagales bacterium]|nr:CHAT domain-containing protein [Cytophagales bacterium]
MRKSITLILFLFSLLKSQSQELQMLVDSSTYYWSSEQFTKAYNALNTAVEISKKAYEAGEENGATNYAYILNQMGIRLYQGENYETAISYYDVAITLYKELEGENGSSHVTSLENLVLCYNALDMYQEALQLYSYLLTNEKYQASTGANIYQTYNTAGICAFQVDNYEVSKEYYEKSLSLITEASPDYWVIVENLLELEKYWSKYAEGYKYLESFLEKFPNKTAYYSNLKAYYYRDLGNATYGESNYLEAIPHFKTMLEFLIEEDSIDRISRVYALEGLSASFINTKNFSIGLPYLLENEKAARGHYSESSDEYLYSLNYLSVAYSELGDYKNANRIYKKAYRIIERSEEANAGEMQALFDTNYVDYLRKLGKYSDAQTYAKRAFEFYSKDEEKYADDLIYSMNQIALLLTISGEYEKAEALFKQTLNIQKEKHGLESPMSTVVASNLTSLYIQTGRNSRALQFLDFILSNDLKLHGANSHEYSFSLQVAGVLYTAIGKNEWAIEALQKSYDIRKILVGDDNREVLRLRQSLGTAYFKAGKLDEAEKILLEVLEGQKASIGTNNFDITLTQNDLALVQFGRKDYPKALKLFQQSYELKKKILGSYNQFTVTSLYNIACTNLLSGQADKAVENFKQSMDDYLYILDEYFPYLSEKERLEYYHTIKGQLGAYFSFLNDELDEHPVYAALLYDTQIKTKAMLLSESMKLRNFLNTHKDSNIQLAYMQWISINEEVAKLEQINPQGAQRVYLDSIKVVGEEYERVLNSLPGISAKTKPTKWQDIASSLKDGEVAIEVIRIVSFDFEKNELIKEKVSYLLLIIDNKTTDHPKYVRLEDGYLMDSKHFNGYKNKIKFKLVDANSYDLFWKPIADQLAGYDKIYFSSDGVYHLLNLNTLLNPATSQYVLNESEIVLVGNTNELLNRSTSAEKAKSAILFGFPNFNTQPDETSNDSLRTSTFRDIFTNGVSDLPGTKVEVENINKLMETSGIDASIYLADQAHEQQLKTVGSTDILHIATHGFFEESSENIIQDDPLTHSGLLLANIKEAANVQEENGIITAKEVAQLNLQGNRLVVLSACETGRGKVVDGEGVYGLQRAFQVAGADHVIISLWKVDDTATQLLMTNFYELYLQSGNPRTALKQAQIKLQEQYPHPNYWGAFYVVGG